MIIGITGTDGAGKGTVVDYLVKQKSFTHYPVREMLIEEIQRRNLPVDRSHMRLVGNRLRKEHGSGYLVQQYLERKKKEHVQNAVIESIRSLGEAKAINENGGVLIAVDADQKLRYERVQARRSESDQVTFEKFIEQEMLEMKDPDPHGMQKQKVIEMADHTILNNGTMEELRAQVDEVLKKIVEPQ